MAVRVFDTEDEAAMAAADHVVGQIEAVLQANDRCALALSGGRSPERMLEELSKADVPWGSVHLFQVDERLAPAGHDARNFTGLRSHLLSRVELSSDNVHPMPVGEADLARACARYTDALQAVTGRPPILDLVHLGLGADGHTASLFPGDPATDERDAEVVATDVHADWRRLTLTVPILRRARHRMWLVTGAEKAQALSGLIDREERLPAARILGDGDALFCDASAANRVSA